MKKKYISPICILTKIILIAIVLLFVFSSLLKFNENKEQKQMDEMRVYHSDKGLVEVNDGHLNIKIQ